MISQIGLMLVLTLFTNGTDDNTEDCTYFGDDNNGLDLKPPPDCSTSSDPSQWLDQLKELTKTIPYDCPADYYGGNKTGYYDLLDRGWCLKR